jgi:hypothetical protein
MHLLVGLHTVISAAAIAVVYLALPGQQSPHYTSVSNALLYYKI